MAHPLWNWHGEGFECAASNGATGASRRLCAGREGFPASGVSLVVALPESRCRLVAVGCRWDADSAQIKKPRIPLTDSQPREDIR